MPISGSSRCDILCRSSLTQDVRLCTGRDASQKNNQRISLGKVMIQRCSFCLSQAFVYSRIGFFSHTYGGAWHKIILCDLLAYNVPPLVQHEWVSNLELHT